MHGIDAAERFGKENLDGAMSVAGKLSRGIAVRYRRANADDENGETVLRRRASQHQPPLNASKLRNARPPRTARSAAP